MDANQSTLRQTIYASLFTALIIVGGYLSFPVPWSPVPLVLADFFILLAGLVLGPAWGLTSAGLYLLLGLIGLPVFAGGKSGIATLFGPTGGFLIGYLGLTFITGWIAHRGKTTRWRDGVAAGLGLVTLFTLGLVWLGFSLKLTLAKTLAIGLLPFLPGTLIKLLAALAVIRPLRSIITPQ